MPEPGVLITDGKQPCSAVSFDYILCGSVYLCCSVKGNNSLHIKQQNNRENSSLGM